MKRVLIIGAVLVLCLAILTVWLATGPGPRPVDDLADKGRDESQRQTSAEQGTEVAGTEAPPTPAPEGTPSTPPEGDSGFRPITEAGTPSQRTDGKESVSSRASQTAGGERDPQVTGTASPQPSQPSSPEAPSDAGPDAVPADPPVMPANEGLGPSAEPEARPEAPAKPDEPAPYDAVVAKPAEPEAPTPRPQLDAAPAPPVLAQPGPERTPVRHRPAAPPGRYETITRATARARPSGTAQVVDRINRGTILNVTGSEGDWLVVYSKRKNITVFVRRDEAMLSRDQRPASTDVRESDWPRVEQEILDALARNNVPGVQVTFIADTAYLKGTVATDAERERAETFARSILEVKHVLNGIRVE